MTFWIDARLSPHLAPWIETTFGVGVRSVKRLGLRDAKDREIFDAARAAEAVVMTKDQDFVALQARLGAPPQIVWVTCGNTSNANMKRILGSCCRRRCGCWRQGRPWWRSPTLDCRGSSQVGERQLIGSLWMPLRVSRRCPES